MTKKLKNYNTIDRKEISVVNKVMKSGNLSLFLADTKKDIKGNGPDGGKYVRKLENQVQKYFNVKYAIAVNSWTSGLICCVGSLQLEPGDEIILPSWTMSACASVILHWNCIPVFSDIDKNTFCIDPVDIEKKISQKTKAIMAVDIFGQSSNISKLKKLAKKYKLKIISDSAQAIGSKYKGKYSGTLADIGGFSFNCHKHIQTGEGGIVVTNDFKLYKKCKLIRNHAETTVGNPKKKSDLINMIGENYRMCEIEAAIATEQLKKLKKIIKDRQSVAKNFINNLKSLPGINIPKTPAYNTNVYYILPLLIKEGTLKISRSKLVEILNKNKIHCFMNGYINVHKLPIFKYKIAYGKAHHPWSLTKNGKLMNYNKCKLHYSEKYNDNEFLGIEICMYKFEIKNINHITKKFKKIWSRYLIK